MLTLTDLPSKDKSRRIFEFVACLITKMYGEEPDPFGDCILPWDIASREVSAEFGYYESEIRELLEIVATTTPLVCKDVGVTTIDGKK